jgi:hypothetical protein
MAMEGIKKVTSALGSAGSKLAAPDQGTAGEIAAKQGQIDEYKNSLQTPASEPKPQGSSSKDKINPGGKYGDRGKEKRIDVKDMMKPLGVPSYQDGVDSVPNDGLAMLHEGEKVVSEKDNPDSHKASKRVKGAMGGEGKKKLGAKKGSKKTVHKVTVHKAANGGVVLEHHLGEGKSEMHAHPDFDSASESMKPMFQSPEPATAPGSAEGGPSGNPQQASPSSFAEGGLVKKSGTADVHKGEVVLPHPDNKEAWRTLPNRLKGAGQAVRALAENVSNPSQANQNFRTPPKQKTPSAPDKDYSAYGAYDMRSKPSSFADGGLVEKSGKAKVHAGEKIISPKKPVRNPDITIGGGAVAPKQMPPKMKQDMKDYDDTQMTREDAQPRSI